MKTLLIAAMAALFTSAAFAHDGHDTGSSAPEADSSDKPYQLVYHDAHDDKGGVLNHSHEKGFHAYSGVKKGEADTDGQCNAFAVAPHCSK